jgi:hypothetical protein
MGGWSAMRSGREIEEWGSWAGARRYDENASKLDAVGVTTRPCLDWADLLFWGRVWARSRVPALHGPHGGLSSFAALSALPPFPDSIYGMGPGQLTKG